MRRGGWCCTRDGCISMSRTDDEHGPLVDLGRERPQVPARARNLSPIVPRASIAGRALVAVVALINAANRLAVIVHQRGGSYEPGMLASMTGQGG